MPLCGQWPVSASDRKIIGDTGNNRGREDDSAAITRFYTKKWPARAIWGLETVWLLVVLVEEEEEAFCCIDSHSFGRSLPLLSSLFTCFVLTRATNTFFYILPRRYALRKISLTILFLPRRSKSGPNCRLPFFNQKTLHFVFPPLLFSQIQLCVSIFL